MGLLSIGVLKLVFVDLISTRVFNFVEVRKLELSQCCFVIRVDDETWRYFAHTHFLLTRHVVVFKKATQHSSSYETTLARKAVHYGKYFSTMRHTDPVSAIEDNVVLHPHSTRLSVEMNCSASRVLNQVVLQIGTS